MGQAIKYTVLGVSLAAIIVVILALIGEFIGSGALADFSSLVASALGSPQLIGAIRNVRGALNYVLGSSGIINICLWIAFLLPVAKIPIQITIAVTRFINQ